MSSVHEKRFTRVCTSRTERPGHIVKGKIETLHMNRHAGAITRLGGGGGSRWCSHPARRPTDKEANRDTHNEGGKQHLFGLGVFCLTLAQLL